MRLTRPVAAREERASGNLAPAPWSPCVDRSAAVSLYGSKMVCVREEAPTVGSGEQLVARPGVADHAPVRVERIPVHGREDGVLTEVANVERDPRPRLNARRPAICADRRSEVIPHRAGIRHVDCLPLPNRKERAETEARNAFHIACDIATGVFVEQRIDRGGHDRTVAVVVAFGQTRARALRTADAVPSPELT